MSTPLISTPGGRRSFLITCALALLVILVAIPFTQGEYFVLLLAQTFLFAAAAVTLDVVWGYTGIPELGHSAWFGTGALVVGYMMTDLGPTGLVMSSGGSFGQYILGILLGTVIAGAIGGLVAWYSFSRNGTHFYIAVVTLALTTALGAVYLQVPQITGGENGIFGYAIDWVTTTGWYYTGAIVFALVTAACWVFVRSDFGLLIRAVRDNERRVRYLGFDVERVKIVTYTMSAAVDGFVGALYSTMVGAVSAPLFGFDFATQMMVWVAVGGRATIIGPAVSTIALSLIGSALNRQFPAQWGLFLGALFVIVMVFFSAGFLPPVARWIGRRLFGEDYHHRDHRALIAEDEPEARDYAPGPVVVCADTRFSYGKLNVLRGVDLEILRGELLCIVGPNGAGKSTLIEVLSDGYRRIQGSVEFKLGNGVRHYHQAPHQIARKSIVRKFQIPALFKSLTVAEHILLGTCNGSWPSFWRRTSQVRVPRAVLDICAATGLVGRENVAAPNLAHGLKQGLEIAMAASARPELMFLDEPTAGLTSNERSVVGDILRELTGAGITLVLIEHDLDFVCRVADRIAVLHDGRVLECGTPDEMMASKVVKEAYLGTHQTDDSVAAAQ